MAFSVNTKHSMKHGQRLCFAAVQVKSRHASDHLMPAYVEAALLDGIAGEPRKVGTQGKSCFNFSRLDDLFTEPDALTAAGRDSYRKRGDIDVSH